MKKTTRRNKEKEMEDFCRALQEFREARRNAFLSDGNDIHQEEPEQYHTVEADNEKTIEESLPGEDGGIAIGFREIKRL